jgi:DNA-binding SARP family transcriptional activator
VRTTVQTYVYQIRRCIEMNGLATDAEALLATRPAGYVFHIDPDQVDVFTFRQLCRQGRVLLDQKRFVEAAESFRAALDLWSGPALVDVNCGSVLSAYAVDLEEQQRAAQHLRMEAEIQGGLHGELIGELRSLTASNPFDEMLHGQLMRVLSLNGRRSDAVATYHELRARLTAELGVEPCDELRLLHHELLSAGHTAQ